jgi:hypothetical protein
MKISKLLRTVAAQRTFYSIAEQHDGIGRKNKVESKGHDEGKNEGSFVVNPPYRRPN